MSDEDKIMLLYQFAGVDDLDTLIENWREERKGMAELHDENTALKIYNRRLRLIVDLSLQIYDDLDGEGGMFLSHKTREKIGKSRNQIALAVRTITESKMICEVEE